MSDPTRDLPVSREPVRVLFAEDSVADAQLVDREFRLAGWKIVTRRVDRPADFESALKEFAPEVILCDYSMPGFGGLEALEVTLAQTPETPFIFVSGTIGEEVATEAIKLGATDYVLKGNLRRLVPVVERALREARDRAEKHRAQSALAESEARWRAIFENAVFGMYQTSPDGRFILANPTLARILGYDSPEELLNTVTDIRTQVYVNPEDRDRFRQLVESSGYLFGFEVPARRKDDSVVYVSLSGRVFRDPSGKPLYYEGFVEDLTVQKQMEAQVRQSQKMETIGLLAGGIAHDFNNMLQAIMGLTELATEKLPPDHPARSDLGRVFEAAVRAADLTQKILTFARKQVVQVKPLPVNGTVSEFLRIFHRVLGKEIETRESLAPEPLIVMMDPAQFDQVLMNLCTNAKQAMPGGGRLAIETSAVNVGPEIPHAYPWVGMGRFAKLSVSDTGLGMPPETLSRIFDPFFTTKPEGTGLGLAVVYGIVKQAGGFITVDSEAGKGSAFHIHLPLAPAGIAGVSSVPIIDDLRGGTHATVLVAEDDSTVRASLEAALTRAGYEVLTAADGKQALRILETHHPPVDLLLTDLQMPAVSPMEFFERLYQMKPALKVVLMSGYERESGIIEKLVATYSVPLLQKPFRIAEVARVVRDTLASRGFV
jgi:PAS domain S-box-containing protein